MTVVYARDHALPLLSNGATDDGPTHRSTSADLTSSRAIAPSYADQVTTDWQAHVTA
ncbi:hypothetical protein ABZ816_32050 [Actinosynnema sp. NPDC047251]|uniref:hypothetical protein n=1 Tax=Saccharothrix espanaensis TaxID=103731 RepID=UPI0003096D85|nr:hypothetical protein [Saccharothrix espanaensis]